MSDKNIAADFVAHVASVRADTEATFALARAEAEKKIRAAQQEIYEAKELMDGIRARAPESFDIIGRLNTLGAERVVQVGEPTRSGLYMFVIDEQNHGTLLRFGEGGAGWAFNQVCWCCERNKVISDPIKTGIVLGLRSWEVSRYLQFATGVMAIIKETIETGTLQDWDELELENPSVELFREFAPALNIEIKKSSPLKLASLTPKEWWRDCGVGHLREKE